MITKVHITDSLGLHHTIEADEVQVDLMDSYLAVSLFVDKDLVALYKDPVSVVGVGSGDSAG